MENATKALEMAGSVLIGVLLLGCLLFAYTRMSELKDTEHKVEVSEQAKDFNQDYETYNRNNLYGSDLFSLANQIEDYNKKEADGKAYGRIEMKVTLKTEIINAVKKISTIIGKDNIYIRYDPIFLSDKYNIVYHIKAFNKLCTLLKGYVNTIIVSFLDEYKNVLKNKNILKYCQFTENEYKLIGENFSNIARTNNMVVQTCFEDRNLTEYGFVKGECLSHELAYKLTGKTYKSWKARKERKCECVEMVDIGCYNSCKHFCKYCYANYDEKMVNENFKNHDVNSSLLCGNLKKDDIIKVRNK